MSKSPVSKRLKLDPSASPSLSPKGGPQNTSKQDDILPQENGISPVSMDVEDEEDHCIICLQRIRDRTVLPCSHDRMCFECILVWTAQSRKCPLCNAPIGPYLIHNIRSKYDYQKRYLHPLRTASPPNAASLLPLRGRSGARNRARAVADRWGTRSRRRSASRERQDMEDELELAVQRRKWVYRHRLFAKHVASNPYTRYRPAPTPAQIAASPDLISRATIFVRRELRIWVNLDVEFLTTFILSLMKSLDVRSESAVKLLAEFLDMDTPYHVGTPSESIGRFRNAEHFAHELYSYLRSPYKDLATYDSVVQYDAPENIPPTPSQLPAESPRWRPPARADTSARQRHSSPSPLSRSPRDAYSRTPSPVYSDSHEERAQYSSPPPRRSLGHDEIPSSGPARNRRGVQDLRRDKKGKGKEIVDPRSDRDAYHGDDGLHRSVEYTFRKHSTSPGRNSALTGRHSVSHPPRESRGRRSPSPAISLSRRGTKGVLDTFSAVSSQQNPALVIGHAVPAAGVRPHQNTTLDQRLPIAGVPAPQKAERTWGISIKGQAKLLKLQQDSSGEAHNLYGPQVSHPHGPELGFSKSGIQSSDALHAHLDRGSTTRDSLPHGASLIDSKGVYVTDETHKADIPGGHSASDEDTPLPNQSLQLSTRGSRSAPEIMARTRAKIARLRGQASVAGVASTSDIGDGASEGTPAALGLRERLLERLAEEKRRVSGDDPDSAAVSRKPGGDSTFIGSTATEVETLNPVSGCETEPDVAVEALQVESKLRAQAQLRVRLAAEKRRFEEEQTMSREDTLRAKLLSRRA